MIAKNVYLSDLHEALAKVNEKYEGNITFKNIEDISTSRTQKCRFTLRVKSSYGPGASRNPTTFRRSPSACWHAHGDFFDALLSVNVRAEIQSSLHGKKVISNEGGNWQDILLGSAGFPYAASEACACND